MYVFEAFPCGTKPLGAEVSSPKQVLDHLDENLSKRLQGLPPRVFNYIQNLGMGIEIEVENATGVNSRGWQVVADNSLRNNGLEFKTNYGYRVGHAPSLLKSLETAMREIRKTSGIPELFNFSERTSVHIHLDARHLTTQQLLGFLMLYTLVEVPLFRWAGPSRMDNIFCVMLRESGVIGSRTNIENYVNTWEKYCAINLRTIGNFGTLEFRHMEGNIDPDRITKWLFILGCLHYLAHTMSLAQIMQMIDDVKCKSHYEALLSSIFHGLENQFEWDPTDIDDAASDAKLLFVES